LVSGEKADNQKTGKTMTGIALSSKPREEKKSTYAF
jgi:hypothetical protein